MKRNLVVLLVLAMMLVMIVIAFFLTALWVKTTMRNALPSVDTDSV